MPGGPSRTTLRASVRNPPEASAPTCWRIAGWASKSKSSSVLTAANPAARIRSWAPEALRARHFAFQDRGEVVLVGPARVAGLVGQPGGGLGDPGAFNARGEVGDLLDRLGARCAVVLFVGGHQLTPPSLDRGRRRGRSRPGPGPDRHRRRRRPARGCWNCLRSQRGCLDVGRVGDRRSLWPRPAGVRPRCGPRRGPGPVRGRRRRRPSGRSRSGRRSSRWCPGGRSSRGPAGSCCASPGAAGSAAAAASRPGRHRPGRPVRP